jgi:peptidyl-tRNA hydrolase, PTH1 family
MRLIVGLGNPGRRYASTPHNVGYEVVEELASRHGLKWTQARRLDAAFADGDVAGVDCMLLKPTTYMNDSGRAVTPLVRGEKLDPAANLLVVLDDVALPLGCIRARAEGSSGGHNGLESVIGALRTQQFPRLRCGVGPEQGVTAPGDLVAYVLGHWPRTLRAKVDEMVIHAADAAEEWLKNGMTKMMNRFNEKRRRSADPED